MRRLVPLFLLLILIPPAVVRAKTDLWSRLGLPGERVTALAIGMPGTIYAGTSSGGVFRVEKGIQTRLAPDSGARSNPVTAIVVDPRNPNTIYTATAEGIFKSIDAGIHWEQAAPNVVGSLALVIDPQNSNTIYAAANGLGLFKSTDAGANWLRTSLAFAAQNVVVDWQNSATVHAATPIGVVKSTDGGATWNSYPWTGGIVRGLAIDPWTPAILYAGSLSGGVFKSINGGVTWSDSGMRAMPVFGLVVDIQDTSTLYAATENGPFKSVDGGKVWSPINEGLTARTTAIVGDLALCKVYIGTDNGAYETDIGPVLAIHSNLCIGGQWSVVVSHAGGNTPIRLLGNSNGAAWEVPNWGTTNGAGMFTASGTFPPYTEGSHQLRIDVGGTLSNAISFTVTNCLH